MGRWSEGVRVGVCVWVWGERGGGGRGERAGENFKMETMTTVSMRQ